MRLDYLREVELMLELPQEKKREILLELEDHLLSAEEDLLASGIDPPEAADEAARDLGDPRIIGEKLSAYHNHLSFRTICMVAVPFIGVTAIALVAILTRLSGFGHTRAITIFLAVAFGVFLAFESTVQIKSQARRPWHACWLGTGLMLSIFVMQEFLYPQELVVMPALLISFSCSLGIAAFIVWISRRSPAWLVVTFLLMSAAVWGLLSRSEAVLYFVWSSLILMTGLRLYTGGKAYSIAQIQLYLFTYLIFGLQAWTRFYATLFEPYGRIDYGIVVSFVMAGLAAVLHARTTDDRWKLLTISLAIPLIFVLNKLRFLETVASDYAFVMALLIWLLLVIGLPTLLGKCFSRPYIPSQAK